MEEEIITPEEEVFDYHKLRYILGQDGYVCHASLGGLIVCDLGECIEYTGEIPNDYSTIEEWHDSEVERLNAWKIVDGNLVFDEARYAQIQKKCAKEHEENRHVCYKEIKNINNIINQDVYEMYQTSESEETQIVEVTDANRFEARKIYIKNIGETITGSLIIKSTNANMLPNDATSKEESGISFAENEDRSITLNGTATADIEYLIAGTSTNTQPILHFKKNIDYFLSSGGYTVTMYNFDGTDREEIYSGTGAIKFTDGDKDITQIVLSIPNGTVIEDETISLMLNRGTEAEPYIMHESNETKIELGEEVFETENILVAEEGNVELYKDGIDSDTYIYLENITMPVTYKDKTYLFAYGNSLVSMVYPNTTKNLEYENTSTKNGGFSVDEEGNITAKSGTVGGYSLTENSLYAEIYPLKDYTDEDLQKIVDYLSGTVELTDEEKVLYDVDGNGEINSADMLRIVRLINANVTTTEHGTIHINNRDPINTIVLKDKDGEVITRIGLLGIDTNKLEVNGADVVGLNAMTLQLSANKSHKVTSAWGNWEILLDQIKTQIGSKLTFENNAITIGSGVRYIKVSGNMMSAGIANHVYAIITQNGTGITTGYNRATNTGYWGTIALSPVVIEVSEGDVIALEYGSEITGTLTLAGKGATYLTVEVVG